MKPELLAIARCALLALATFVSIAHAQPARDHATSSAHPIAPPATYALSPALLQLIPDPRVRSLEQAASFERALSHLLRALPGVAAVETQVVLPVASEQALDQPLTPAHVSVVLSAHDARSRRDEVTRLTRGLAPLLASAHVTLVENAQRDRVRAIALAERLHAAPPEDTSGALRFLLALSLGANVLLAAAVLWRARVRRPGTAKA